MHWEKRLLPLLAELIRYPDAHYYLNLDSAIDAATQGGLNEARDCLLAFQNGVQSLTLPQIEEAYTRTFDLNPVATLDIGWHLFGENYARGELLVMLRRLLRDAGVDERGELPDHLGNVLLLIAVLEEDKAKALCDKYVLPAVTTIGRALQQRKSIFTHLIEAVRATINAADRAEVCHE